MANLPILGELLILLAVIAFGVQQIRSINRLQRERREQEAEKEKSLGADDPDNSGN